MRGEDARAPRGPHSSAAFASASASTALGASAVTATRPVNAGCAGRRVEQVVARSSPSAPRQMRERRPDVATAPSRTWIVSSVSPVKGCSTSTSRTSAGVAADAQVAAAVDGPGVVAGEQLAGEVGGVALAGAAGVEAQARRAA